MPPNGIRVGTLFPQSLLRDDPAAIRHYAQALEAMGIDRLMLFDHIIGHDSAGRPELTDRSTIDSPMHEVFTLIAWLAALTERLEFFTYVLVLPQRNVALVAKQAAEIAILSGNRLLLGVGTGWNRYEYADLGEDFANRGAVLDEQIELLRAFWQECTVTYAGAFHTFDRAGINPRPSRPVPVWIGGAAPVAIRRAARTADGFIPVGFLGGEAEAQATRYREELQRHGRTLDQAPIAGWIELTDGDPGQVARDAATWQRLGADTVTLFANPPAGSTVDDHLATLQRAVAAIRRSSYAATTQGA